MRRHSTFIPAFVLLLFFAPAARADVVVIANRTKSGVRVVAMPAEDKPKEHTIEGGEVYPLSTIGPIRVAFQFGRERLSYTLAANTAYAIGPDAEGRLDVHKLRLDGDERTARGTGVAKVDGLDQIGTIPVKILVDDDERASARAWQGRLRRRIENASDILEKHCGLRLKVVAVQQWHSDNRLKKFPQSLEEFEKEVDPAPGRIAIGFTSQYEVPRGRTHLGGTRGPFHPHILIREWSQHITEAERLEVLVHEVGHVMGAAHSADPNSVMRPSLGDRKSRQAKFRIKFDAPNTLAMSLIAEEMRFNSARKLADLSSPTRIRLRQIYAAMSEAFPRDPAARRYEGMMGRATLAAMADGTRHVVRHITRAAAANAELPAAGPGQPAESARRTGDDLMDYYVCQAAWAAKELPEEHAPTLFLLGLAIALDDQGVMRKSPFLRDFCRVIESDEEHGQRIKLLGRPTMRSRHDLAQHFVVSAYLTVVVGARASQAAGLAKELNDSSGASGFSFSDMAANQAGILFARGVGLRQFTLLHLADEFSVAYYLPSVEGLPDGINRESFEADFGSPKDPRFAQVIRDIDRRLRELPPYQSILFPLVNLKAQQE